MNYGDFTTGVTSSGAHLMGRKVVSLTTLTLSMGEYMLAVELDDGTEVDIPLCMACYWVAVDGDCRCGNARLRDMSWRSRGSVPITNFGQSQQMGYYTNPSSGLIAYNPGSGMLWADDYSVRKNNDPPQVSPENQYVGAVRGWRIWLLDGTTLTALHREHRWMPGENVASGQMGKNAMGGFYAFNDLNEIKRQERARLVEYFLPEKTGSTIVFGSILGYGHVVVGEKGFRSRHAVIENLILSGTDTDWDFRLMTVAEKYGVEVISAEQAGAMPTGVVEFVKEEEA